MVQLLRACLRQTLMRLHEPVSVVSQTSLQVATIFGEAERVLSAVLIRHSRAVIKGSNCLCVGRYGDVEGSLHLSLRVSAQQLLVV